jgi:hypothetical protein
MSGNLESGLVAVVRSAKEPEAYFAEKLRKSMVGKIHLRSRVGFTFPKPVIVSCQALALTTAR